MSLLTLDTIGQSFGDFDLFTGLSAQMQPDSKIGLVGANGRGKTTLLHIIAGIIEPTRGTVTIAPQVRFGYLQQEAVQAFAQTTHALYAEMETVFASIQAMQIEMQRLEADYGNLDEADQNRYIQLLDDFHQGGGYDYEQRIERTLYGLGFTAEDYETPIAHLSGGQKTRALLAKLLLSNPDLLILDEPTNHLDMDALIWLENALKTWQGALLIVSHDRYFLDKVVNTIWELTPNNIDDFRGNYSAYQRQKRERLDYHIKLYEREKARLQQEFDFIKRNIVRAATNGIAAGKLRRLSRDLVAIEELGLVEYLMTKNWSDTGLGSVRPYTVAEAERAIKAIRIPTPRAPKLRVKLQSESASGETVLRLSQVKIGYPNQPLWSADELEILRGQVVALIGGNGTGKSTLLKTILKQLKPLRGTITLGINVQVGYFAQAHDGLNIENTVINELLRHKESMLPADARHHLAQYLFRGDDVFKRVGSLSGGERGRLALAILALQGANFLLLDEPTNHLDIPAQQVLQEVLETFEGTILLVSHDRYLIDRLATHIWEVREGKLTAFDGTYQEFLTAEAARPPTEKAKHVLKPPRPTSASDERRKIETQINSLEASLKEVATLLQHAAAAGRGEEIQRLNQAYHHQQIQLDELMATWERLG